MRSGMRKSTRVSAIAFAFAVSAISAAGPALAGEPLTGTGGLPYREYGWGYYGNGPAYYGESGYYGGYGPAAYDSYAFAYEYPAYTGTPVTATAVELFNYRFRHRQVVGPGVAYYRSEYPRGYRINRYW